MNRRRNEKRPSAMVYVAIILAAAISIGGVIAHAYFKNRQIQVNRQITEVENSIGQYRLDINVTKMRMDELLNRFAMRKQLEDLGSDLRPIPSGFAEDLDPNLVPRPSVAAVVH